MLDEKVLKDIESKVKEIEQIFKRIKGLILSESDLKCLIYHKMYGYFSAPEQTEDEGIKAISLHSEISWFDEEKKLTIRPDITIIDPRNLNISKNAHNYTITNDGTIKRRKAGKPFYFWGKGIIIEIKFISKKSGVDQKTIDSIGKDVAKYQRLARINDKLLCLLVVFNKTNNGFDLFERNREQWGQIPNLKIIYGSSCMRVDKGIKKKQNN
jgi:hypothetical protein